MKLKKGISLLLVLTMALSFMSFAFTASAEDDTADIAIVADKDTSALKAGDTFVANVKLSNIAAKQLFGVQIKFGFDPTVLQVVDSSGAETTNVAQAFVPCLDIYDAVKGTGYFTYDLSAIDNTEGKISFVASKSSALLTKPNIKVECADGNYVAAGIRFKVLKEGLTGLEINEDEIEIFCGNETEKATITDITEEIRIGIVKQDIVSVGAIADQKVAIDTPLEDVLAELPEKVDVSFDDGTTGKVEVSEWTCASYNSAVAGDYTFEGTLATSEAITNTNNLKASVKVTVSKLDIVSIASGSVKVPFGATKDQVDQLLPDVVTATVEGDKTVELPVVWTYTYTPEETTGDVAVEGAVEVGTKYTNTQDVKAAYTLVVSAKIDTETDATIVADSVPANLTVPYEGNKAAADVVAQLPQVIELQVGDVIVAAFVDWTADAGYDSEKAGTYTFTGTITVPENVTLESATVSVPVTISPAVEKVVKTVNDTLEDKTVKESSASLISLYPAEVNVTYQDGTTGTAAIVWDDATKALKANKAGTYTLNGKVGSISVSAKVTVESSGGGGDNTKSVYVYLNGKVINNTTQSLFTGRAVALTASESVTWSTSNSSIAMITKDGRLVGNSPGIATITATGSSGYGVFYVKVTLDPVTIPTIDDSDNNNDNIVIPFSDLGDYSWASRMICKLAADGIISGKTSTLYAPGDDVTRAEYASLLVRALKLSTNNTGKEFTDVAAGEWYCNAVQTASALGVVSGYEDGSFHPNAQITREEMAVMTLRAAEAAGRIIPTLTSVSFTDADQVSGYAQDAVNILACGQLISGMGDGSFAPQATANRAQAAVIIYKLSEL